MEDILEKYQRLLGTIDSWFHDCAAKSEGRVRCAPGCCGCCRGLFDITLLDARLLREGLEGLEERIRAAVLNKAFARLRDIRRVQPDFAAPFLLDEYSTEERAALMPEEDETPCPLLSEQGQCLVYEFRPMICRHHGIPNIDLSGEVFSAGGCTLHGAELTLLSLPGLRWDFRTLFTTEFNLVSEFSQRLLGVPTLELDTVIPTALLIDFKGFDWKHWWVERKK